jgi:hypothetical protein
MSTTDLTTQGLDFTIQTITNFISNFGSYGLNVTQEQVSSGIANVHLSTSTTAPYNSLVGYWSFDADNSTTAFDLTGNNNDGTYTNGAYSSSSSGKYGSGAFFDGVDDYITMGTPSNLALNNTWTVSAWINPATANQNTRFVLTRGQGPINYYIQGGSTTGSYYAGMVLSNGTSYYTPVATKLITANSWALLTATFNGSEIDLYVNGTLNSSLTNLSGINMTNIAGGTQRFSLGARADGINQFFNGSIDEVMIFNTSLNSTQIQAIYNNQSARFVGSGYQVLPAQTVNPGNGTAVLSVDDYDSKMATNISASLSTWNSSLGYNNTDPNLVAYYHADNVTGNGNIIDGKVGNALNFVSASSQYVRIPSNSIYNTSTLTYMAWVKRAGNNGGGSASIILSSQLTSSGGHYLAFGASTNTPIFLVSNTTTTATSVSTTGTIDTNWHHLVGTYNSSGLYIYLDGVLNNTNLGNYGTPTMNANTLGIGALSAPSNYFNGSIDQVRMWNRSLTATEIANIYNNESTGIVDPNMNRTGLVGEWLMDKNVTSLWATTTQDTSIYSNHGGEVNMIGANITDSSGNGNNGVTQGGTNLLNTGQYNQSFYFNKGFVSIPITTTNNMSKYSTGSVSVWANPNNLYNYFTMVGAGRSTARYGYSLYGGSSGILYFDMATSGAGVRTQSGAGVVTTGWSFYIATWNGTNTTLYKNGVVVATGSQGVMTMENSMRIGAFTDTIDTTFNGSIDEVMIWNKSLSATEVSDLYSRGRANWAAYTPEQNLTERTGPTFNYSASSGIVSCWIDGVTDSCGGGNNGVLVGGANWSNANRGTIGNLTAGFNGNGDYITYNHNDNLNFTTNNFSISGWFRINNKITPTYQYLISKVEGAGSGSKAGWALYYYYIGNLYFIIQKNSSNYYRATYSLADTNWHHFTAVREDNTPRLYIDGILQTGTANVGTVPSGQSLANTYNLTISRDSALSSSYYMNGNLDEVAIWNRSLDAKEVRDIYLKSKQGRSNFLSFAVPNATTNLLTKLGFYSDSQSFYTPWVKNTNGSSGIAGMVQIPEFVAPVITYVSGNYINTTPTTLSCLVNDSSEILNVTTYLWNSTGALNSTYFQTYVDTPYTSSAQFTLNPLTNYTWNCYACDFYSNCAWASYNASILYDSIVPNVTLSSPANFSVGLSNITSFNASVSDNYRLVNATLYVWNSTGTLLTTNTTSLSGTSANVSSVYTLPYDNVYAWNYQVCDLATCVFSVANYTLIYDLTAPSGNNTNPANTSTYYTNYDNFTASLSDSAGVRNSTLHIWNSTAEVFNYTWDLVQNTFTTTVGVVVNLADGVYTWFYDLFDWVGNRTLTGNNTFVVRSYNVTSEPYSSSLNYAHLATSLNAPYTVSGLRNLVGYWSFDADNSTTAFDLTGNNNDGTYTNGAYASSADGKYVNGAHFDGVDDFISINNNPSINFTGSNPFTLSLWAKRSGGTSGHIIGKRIGCTSGTIQYQLGYDSAGLNFYEWDSSAHPLIISPNIFNYSNNLNWNHILFTYNGTHGFIYVNNALMNSSALTFTNNYVNTNLLIGESGTCAYFNGSIDDVMIFNSSLTAAQISAIYNNQSARFFNKGSFWLPQYNISSGNNIAQLAIDDFSRDVGTNLTASLGTWDISKGYNNTDPNLVAYYHADNVTGIENIINGKVGNALNFVSASSQYVRIPSNSIYNTSTLTYMAWVKRAGNSGGGSASIILSSQLTSSGGHYLAFGASTNTPIFLVSNTTTTVTSVSTTGTIDTNWHHLVGTYNSSGLYIYLDGVLNNTNLGNYGTPTMNANTLGIGALSAPSNYFNGSIDQVRMWNRSLTATEIANIYNNESTGIVDPNMNRTGLVGEWLMDKDVTSLWATTTQDTSIYSNHGGEVNMIGANITDSSGNGNTGVANGGTNLLSAGKYNQTLTFDGRSGYVNLSNMNSLWNNVSDKISMSAWVKTNSLSTQQTIISKYRSSVTYTGATVFSLEATGRFMCFINNYTASNYVQWQTTSQVIFDNSWHYLTCSIDLASGIGNLYLDGAYVSSTKTVIGTAPTKLLDSIVSVKLGKYIGMSNNDLAFFNGSIDEVMIWNRSLSATEVSDLYSRGRANWQYTSEQNITDIQNSNTYNYSASSGIVSCWIDGASDSCGGGNNGNMVNGANWTNSGRGVSSNLGLSLNGIGSYMNVSDLNNPLAYTNISMSAWVYSNAISTEQNIVGKMNSSNKGWYCEIYTSKLNCGVDTNNQKSSSAMLQGGRWYHIVMTHNDTHIVYYINGAVDSTQGLAFTITNPLGYNLKIGSYPGNIYPFKGFIDELAIWNRTLNASEVSQIYSQSRHYKSNNTFTIPTTTTNILPKLGLYSDSNQFFTPWVKATNFISVDAFLDSDAPSGNSILPVNNTYTNSSMNFTLNATDNYGLANATLNLVNNAGQIVNQTTYFFGQDTLQAVVGVVVNLVDGVYTWFWNIFDLTGNIFTVAENRTAVFDTVKPVVSFSESNPANGSARKDWFYVNVTIADSGFGFNDSVFGNVSYNWNGSTMLFTSANVSNFVNLGDGNWQFIYNQSGLVASEDDYYYEVTVYDLAGNINSSETRRIRGNTNPTIVFNDNSDLSGNYSKDYIFVNVTGNDIDMNLDSIIVYLYNGTYNETGVEINRSLLNNNVANIENSINFTNQKDGWYYVNASANDSVGMIGWTETRRILLDRSLPNGTQLIDNNYYSSSSGNNFSATIRDNLGIRNVSLYIYNVTGGLVNVTAITNFGADTLQATVGVVVNLVDGIYSWFYEIFDLSGNRGVTENRTIMVDTTKPLISAVVYSPMNNIYNDSIDPNVRIYVNATITDNVAGINTTLLRVYNGSLWADIPMGLLSGTNLSAVYNTSFVTQPSETNYTFYVWTNDTSGNWNVSGNYSFESAWDCSWNMSLSNGGDLGQFFGFNEKKNFVNFTIYNTGDVNYTGSCPLNFIVYHNLLKSGEGSLRIDDHFGPSWPYEHITAGQSVNVKLYFNYRNQIYSDALNLTVEEDSGNSEIAHTDSLVATLISTSGPYLYQSQLDPVVVGDSASVIKRNSSYYDIYLTNQTVVFNSSIRNGVGDGSANMSAYNVSSSILFDSLFNVSYANDSDSVNLKNGSTEFFYNRISDGVSGETHYNSIILNLSDFANSVSTNNTYLFMLNSLGFNQFGNQIVHANNISVLNNSFSVRFLCNPISDGYCVEQCDKDLLGNGSTLYDPDCPYCGNGVIDLGEDCNTCKADMITADPSACSATQTVTTNSGGGGGGGGGGGAGETRIDYVFVRGQTNEIVIPFKNKDVNNSFSSLNFSVSGDVAKYIQIIPNSVSYLAPGDEINIIMKITSPSYLKLGKQEILVYITGNLAGRNYNENKRIVLQVVEVSAENALKLIDGMADLLQKMMELNLSTDKLEGLLNASKEAFDSLHYEKIVENSQTIQEQANNALGAYKIVQEMISLENVAGQKGINTDGSKRLVKLAQLSLSRAEYSEAYARAKEAQVTYALEVKGEIGKFSYYLKNNPREISLSAFFLILLGFTGFKVGQVQLLRAKIRKLKDEERIFQQLIKVVQVDAFEKKKMSIEEYEQSIKYYECKLSEIIEKLIECESKRAYALRFTSGETRLKQERERIVDLIKEIQKIYLQQGKMETKSYELRLESYNRRLGIIDERLANIEAKQALKGKGRFVGLFGRGK